MVTTWIKGMQQMKTTSGTILQQKWLNGTQLLLLRASLFKASCRFMSTEYFIVAINSTIIHNDAPCCKSQNDFCSFGRVIWLLTQCFKLISFYIYNNKCRPQRRPVASSFTSRWRWRSRNTECWVAGTVSIFIIICIHTLAPAVHTPR